MSRVLFVELNWETIRMYRHKWFVAVLLLALTGSLNGDEYDATSLEALRSGMPDPAIVESHDGSGYYVFATGHGVKVFHSADLLSW